MHHGILKHARHSPHEFHASTYFLTALGIAIAVLVIAVGLFAAFGATHHVFEYRIAFGLGSLLTGLLSASAIFDRYETRD